jgi:hypothetical protein
MCPEMAMQKPAMRKMAVLHCTMRSEAPRPKKKKKDAWTTSPGITTGIIALV